MKRNMFSVKKGSVIFFVLAVLLFSFSVVAAEGESCSSEADCAVGEVCEDEVCTAFCVSGETECSDGVDNDGDGTSDYLGICTILLDAPPADFPDCNACDSFEEGTLCGDYCISPERYGNACNALWGTYTQGDSDCVSPLDTSESEPECSDGVDNDGDGTFDYLGICTILLDSPPADFPDCNACESFEEGTLCGDYCISSERYGAACGALWGSYTSSGDSDCTSLSDSTESVAVVQTAPAVEKGFFAKLWEKLFGSR